MKAPTKVVPLDRLGRLIGLAKRNGELTRTDPASEIELLGRALADLAAERAEADQAINVAAEQRERLLLEPNSDTALDELDRRIDIAQRCVERLDRIEPLLLAQLRNRREAFRQRHFEALAERYRGAVAEYCATLRRVLELKVEIVSIRDAGERAGFDEARLYFETPYLQCSDPTQFEFSVLAALDNVRVPAEPELVSVRFTKRCGLYRADEVAGFPAEVARQYVQAGVAERVEGPNQ